MIPCSWKRQCAIWRERMVNALRLYFKAVKHSPQFTPHFISDLHISLSIKNNNNNNNHTHVTLVKVILIVTG